MTVLSVVFWALAHCTVFRRPCRNPLRLPERPCSRRHASAMKKPDRLRLCTRRASSLRRLHSPAPTSSSLQTCHSFLLLPSRVRQKVRQRQRRRLERTMPHHLAPVLTITSKKGKRRAGSWIEGRRPRVDQAYLRLQKVDHREPNRLPSRRRKLNSQLSVDFSMYLPLL